MTNKFTNFFNSTANASQNTGGGASHVWRYAAMVLMVLTLGIGNAWGTDTTFVAGTSKGELDQSTTVQGSIVKVVTNATGAKTQDRQIWKDGNTNKNEKAFQLSSSAGNDPSSKYIEVSVASGYKITGLTIRGAIASTSSGTYTAFCWAGDYSTETGTVTGTGSLAFPGYNVSTSDGANISMTGIVNGTRTIRIYKQVKYNSTTNTIGNISGASSTPSSAPGNLNVASITVTYAAVPAASYTITYDKNGGTGTMSNSTNTVSECTFTAPSGKEFKEWNTLSTGLGDSYDPGDAVTSDLNLYAIWQDEATKYSVTYDLNGPSGDAPTQASVASGTSITLAAAPSWTDYTFLGWLCDIDSETKTASSSYTMTATNTTFTAQWKVNAPVISFNSSTGEVTISAAEDATIYYTDDNGTPTDASSEYSEAFTIDENKTIKAIAVQSGYTTSSVASKSCALCEEPDEVTNEIARFFVPCNQPTNAGWTTASATASSTGKNTFTVSGLGGSSDWSVSASNGLIYGKFGSSSYVTISLNNDKPFKAGDVVIAYFNSNDAKCNLKLHDGEGNALGDASASSLAGEYQRSKTLVAADIESDGSLKFVRVDSKTYLNRIIVTREPAPKHSVTYALGTGASGTTPTQDDVEEETSFTLHNGTTGITAPSGKVFAGWNDGSKTYAGGASYTMGTSDVTLTAQWANKYTVTLMPAGGSAASYDGWTYDNVNDKYTKEVASGTEVALPTFTKTNRTFKTWRNAVPSDVESPITVTANVTLTAVWNATIENIIYYWEGAEGGATEVGGTAAGSADNSINQLDAGYYCLKIDGSDYVEITLSGSEKVLAGDKISYWGFYDKNSSAHASPKMVDGNNTSTVIFADATDLPNLNGGEGTPAKRDFTAPEGINTGKVRILRNQTGSKTWIPKIQIIREVVTEEDNVKTVTFQYNDGATANKVVEVVSGAKVSKPADPTWTHHRFNEWQLSGSTYDFSSTVASNIVLDATWTQLYTITYANGGGSGTAPTQIDKAATETFTVAANTFTAPDGKEFDKWNDGTKDYAPGATYTVGTANVTLTAVWRTPAAHYTITYDKGANGTGSIAAGDKTEDVAFTLSAERFTRDGYVQTGWAESDGGTKAYDLGGTYSANADITLYPVWTAPDTYTASFACSASAPASWTFSTDESWADNKTIAAYVCKFVENKINTPKTTTGDGTSDDDVAFAKNTDAIATYDLGITTTVAALNVTLVGGSSSAFDQTIEYLGSDGSTVKKTYTNSLSAGNWKDNAISKTDIIEDVRYIRVHGAGKWVVMKDFSVKYIETRTKYNVSFAAGTGASGSMDAVQYIAGATVTLPECTFTAPTGKEFDAWVVTKTAGGEEVTVTDGKFTMPAEAVTATATWQTEIIRHTVAYYDGESKLGEEDVVEGETPADYADYQTKDGYVFVGWYNDDDLEEEHKVTIASEEITADANYYGKWALDLQVTKIVFSNGFDAFIKNNTVKAYYMSGESAPTISSYAGTNLKAEGGVTISGDKIVLTGTDDSEKELALTLEAVTPMALYDKQTFDGTETYVKTGASYTAERGWRIAKDVEEPSNKRISEGQCRIYFFLGGGADKATLRSFENRPVKIYVNNVQTSITSVPKQTTFDIPLDPNDTKNMIAIVSNGSNGDAGFYDITLNEHVTSSDASLSSLTVNGNAVDLASSELVAGVMTYKYELPYGTEDAPTVAAVANNAFAELGAITQAVSTTGTATFTVTAEDASTQAYAVKFHVSLNPKYVIYDGSTMTNIASRTYSDVTVGFSYTMGNDLPIAGDEVNATLGTKTYTHVVKGFRPDNDPTFSIVVPTGYMAKVYMVIASNSNNSTRTLFISKTATGTVDTSYGYAISNQQTELVSATSEFLASDTYYFGTNDGVRLYELSVTLYHIDYTRETTPGRLGTICLEKGGTMRGAAVFEIAYYEPSNQKIYLDEVLNGEMTPGMPYVFLPDESNNNQLVVMYGNNAAVATAGNYNGLYGSFTKEELTPNVGNYIFSENLYWYVNSSKIYVGKNRAYLVLSEVQNYPTTPAPGRRRVSMGAGAQAPNTATGLDAITNDQSPITNKVLINGQLYILRGEKLYDATGRMVK